MPHNDLCSFSNYSLGFLSLFSDGVISCTNLAPFSNPFKLLNPMTSSYISGGQVLLLHHHLALESSAHSTAIHRSNLSRFYNIMVVVDCPLIDVFLSMKLFVGWIEYHNYMCYLHCLCDVWWSSAHTRYLSTATNLLCKKVCSYLNISAGWVLLRI